MFSGKVNNMMLFDESNLDDKLETFTDKEKEAYYKNKMNKFQYGSAIDGYQLAAYFSIIEDFTVSDMKFVQQHMLPESKKEILINFALSNLVESINSDDKKSEPRYKINEGLSLILKRSLRNRDAKVVELLLKEKNSQSLNIDKQIKFRI